MGDDPRHGTTSTHCCSRRYASCLSRCNCSKCLDNIQETKLLYCGVDDSSSSPGQSCNLPGTQTTCIRSANLSSTAIPCQIERHSHTDLPKLSGQDGMCKADFEGVRSELWRRETLLIGTTWDTTMSNIKWGWNPLLEDLHQSSVPSNILFQASSTTPQYGRQSTSWEASLSSSQEW